MKYQMLRAMTVLALVGMGRAHADPITFTETATIQVNRGVGFQTVVATLTGVGDTSNVSGPQQIFSTTDQGYVLQLTSATLTVPTGIYAGTYTFKDTIIVVDDNTASQFYFADPTAGAANSGGTIIGEASSNPFNSYALNSPIGPVTGGNLIANSSLTSFAVTNAQGLNYSFQFFAPNADPGNQLSITAALAVPEPSSIVLSGLAGVLAYGFHRARVRRAAKTV